MPFLLYPHKWKWAFVSLKSACLQLQVSVVAVRQLDRNLFEAYIERRADPIAGSLEPGMYAGYFDWRDCQMPTGSRKPRLTACVSSPHLRWRTDIWGHSQPLQTDLVYPAVWEPARLFSSVLLWWCVKYIALMLTVNTAGLILSAPT